MSGTSKPVVLVSSSEQNQINREVLVWLNTYPDKPVDVIKYEELSTGEPSMALSVIQGAFITRRYILGGYEAEYQFKLVYRINPGNSMDKKLKADEMLDSMGEWATVTLPDVSGISVRKVEVTSRSAVLYRYENGEEDHQILMKLTYEVNV